MINGMKNERISELNKFLSNLGLTCDLEKLNLALTHSSLCNDKKLPYAKCNERLEFLGDAVLKLAISDYLYEKYPEYHEGDMSAIRSLVVSDETLCKIARKIEFKNICSSEQARKNLTVEIVNLT